MENALKKYWPLYLLSIVIAFVLRDYSKITDSDVITWMLTPTVWWVSFLSGIPFKYLPHQGYLSSIIFESFPRQGDISCPYRFLVAPSCAGIRFLMILFVMLIFSFLHRIERRKRGYLWFGFCFVFSYFATILVNSVRIIASIYLPQLLGKSGITWMTDDRLHTLIGTGVYFSSLCLLHLLAAAVCRRFFTAAPEKQTSDAEQTFVPVFWYLLIVLVLPFGKRILTNEWEGFGEYALLILCSCFVICTLLYAAARLRRRRAHKQSCDAGWICCAQVSASLHTLITRSNASKEADR